MNELKQRTNSTNASEHLDQNWLTLLESAISITAMMIIPNWQRTSHDSDDDFHSVCPSSSHCQH